jgi:AbrB family looped-hinge helix DNA binding protein
MEVPSVVKAIVGSRGQVVIPAALRKKYRLQAGTKVVFREEQGRLVLDANPFDAFRSLRGAIDAPLLEWLAEDKAEERRRDDAP